MPIAMQHPKVTAPRPHGLPILVRHNPRDLVQVSQIMSRPGRQQFRQSHHPKRRMPSHATRGLLSADSKHATRPDFPTANEQTHLTAAAATYLESLAHAPADQTAQTSESRQIATQSAPAASNPFVPHESDGRQHRAHSSYPHPHFATSTSPADHAEAHQEQQVCDSKAISCLSRLCSITLLNSQPGNLQQPLTSPS